MADDAVPAPPFPTSPADARAWAREAAEAGRYLPTGHFLERLLERKLVIDDVRHVLVRSVRVEAYPDLPRHGGSCWRVHGKDLTLGRNVAVGVELCRDDSGKVAILCTVIVLEKRR